MSRFALLVPFALVASGCPQAAPPPAAPEPTPYHQDVSINLLEPRPVELRVAGPAALGANGAITPEAPKFRVHAASDGFLPVPGAKLHMYALDDAPVGREITADAQGAFKLLHVVDRKPLSATATFTVAGKTYRLRAIVPIGPITEPIKVDPVSTLIDAHVKTTSRRLANAGPMTGEDLARLYGIADRAGMTLATELLTDDIALASLEDRWASEVAKVTDTQEQNTVKAFFEALARDAAGRP